MHEQELTEDDLAAIEARCNAATPGPWESWIEGRDHFGGDSIIRTADADLYLLPVPTPQHHQDQDFIAAARQDVPRLIAEVRRLRRLIAERESGSKRPESSA